MAKRPTNKKQGNAMRRALRKGRLDSFIDLTEFMVDRKMAKSKKEARELILAKRVRAGSHVLGVAKGEVMVAPLRPWDKPTFEEKEYVDPIVPAKLRDEIVVI